MDLVQIGYHRVLEECLGGLNPTARKVFSYLLLRVHPFASIWKQIITTSRQIQRSEEITRNQVNYALKTLRSLGLISTDSSQGKVGLVVTINWSKLGLGAKDLQSSKQTIQALLSSSSGGPPAPQKEPHQPPLVNKHGPAVQQVAKSIAMAPIKGTSEMGQSFVTKDSTSSTTAQITPKVVPPAMASGDFLPTPKPTFRAMLSQERLKELCVKPPASFAALFDEVEPDWRVNTKPHYMRQIEAVDEAFRPKQMSEWAMWQMLKPTTNRPASYLPKLFQWDDPKGPYPGKNTLKNVADDDPTGAKRAKTKAKQTAQSFESKERTPEEQSRCDTAYEEMKKRLQEEGILQ